MNQPLTESPWYVIRMPGGVRGRGREIPSYLDSTKK